MISYQASPVEGSRDYLNMFDEDLKSYWLGDYNPELGQNYYSLNQGVSVMFRESVAFRELVIITRPQKKYFGDSYKNLCLYLDSMKVSCTSKNYEVEGSSPITFTSPQVKYMTLSCPTFFYLRLNLFNPYFLRNFPI